MAVDYSQFQQQQQLQLRMASAFASCGAGTGGANQAAAALFPQAFVTTPQVFSEPVSDLTCNISGSRKRAREDESLMQQATAATSAMLMYQQQQQQQLMLQKQYQQQLLLQNQIQLCKSQPDAPVIENSRLNQSIMTSTSGRPTTAQHLSSFLPVNGSITNNNNRSSTASAGLSFPSTSLISVLNQQSLEVDDLVRLHSDKLRSALDDTRKRQCRVFVSAVAQQAQARIAEKQAEVEAAEKRSVELQENLRQVAAEGQAWYNVARNSEVVIASLRESLEQVLMQKDNCVKKGVDSQLEGYGDSEEEEAVTAAAGTSASSAPCPGKFTQVSKPAGAAFTASAIHFSPCKSCGTSDGCVVVLPCRHLCLCPSCEPSADECPVCHGRKNGSLPINLS